MSDENFESTAKQPDVESNVNEAASWSKVNVKKNNLLQSILVNKTALAACAIVLVVLMMMFFSGTKKSDNKNLPDHAVQNSSGNAELHQNLSYLHNNQEVAASTINNAPPLISASLLMDSQKKQRLQQQMLARQNAPTSMFSASNKGNIGASNVASANTTTTAATSNAGNTFSGNDAFSSFGNQSMTTSSVTAKKIQHPQYTIASGEFLHAVLETAISSDLPGEIRAVVSEPVYAYVGETPLIPAGSRLIGQYSSSVLQGQNRVFVIWNRVILPNGISAQINSPGEDEIGRAGQTADDVNTHFFARFGQASLLSIIGAGAATGGVGTNDQYNSAAQYRMAISQSFSQSASDSLKDTLQIKPTISVDQGSAINVFVSHDIDFYNVMHIAGQS